jgi:FKBP-type peptidyl-prolyl cis-trans isomerase
MRAAITTVFATLGMAALAAGCSHSDQSASADKAPPADVAASADPAAATAQAPPDSATAAAGTTPTAPGDSGTQDTSMPTTAPKELQSTDLKPGTGAAIKKGQTAVVHYTGWLYSDTAPDHKGTKFDSSLDRNDPFSFNVGGGDVIGGWDQGVVGMQPGGQRRLVIPPALGYGASGAGGVIPPNATLVFDIQLLSIK